MNFRWAIGTVIAVLSAMLVLPAIAMAHEADLSGTASECRDAQGGFSIDWELTTYFTPDDRELDGFDDSGYAPGGNDYTESPDNGVIDVVDGGVAASLGLDDFTDSDHGNTLDVDGIHGNGSATAQTVYDGSSEPNETIYAEGRVQWTPTYSNSQTDWEWNVRSNDVQRPDYCKESVCFEGDIVDQPVNELQVSSDCGFINVCIGGTNGEVERMNEHDAKEAGLEEGECMHDDPPEITTTSTEPEEPIEEVEEAVLEVAPVDEVVALPAAGYGSTQSGFAWTALAGLSLIAIGGGLVLAARRS